MLPDKIEIDPKVLRKSGLNSVIIKRVVSKIPLPEKNRTSKKVMNGVFESDGQRLFIVYEYQEDGIIYIRTVRRQKGD